MEILSLFFIFLAFSLNGFMDKIDHNWSSSIFKNIDKNSRLYKWMNPRVSWYNKWKLKDGKLIPLDEAPFYYLWLYNPKYKERFIYSSTFLVFLTDAWHLAKHFMILSIILSILFYAPIFGFLGDLVLYFIVLEIGFNLFYHYVLE